MPAVLIVDDSRMFANMLTRRIERELNYGVVNAESMAEAATILQDHASELSSAVLDLTLPDSFAGEIVDLVAPQLPSIVLTGNLSDAMRDHIWSRRIADYVLKEGNQSIDYVLAQVRRLHLNADIKTLIVDDSRLLTLQVSELLTVHRYQVFHATDGVEALEVLDQHPDIRLVITDYNMPRMDGFELVRSIRKRFSKDDMAIIGMSAAGNNIMSAKFIKNGANDFLTKPFGSEEFYCRINHNMDMIEHINLIKDMSNKDYMTKLYNRRYFFDEGMQFFQRLLRKGEDVALAMLDIDRFKDINDTYGHEAGDMAIKYIAAELRGFFPAPHLISRFGGEEFCILLAGTPAEELPALFENLRARIEANVLRYADEQIRFTLSGGVTARRQEPLEAMIRRADQLLYMAKTEGRNQMQVEV